MPPPGRCPGAMEPPCRPTRRWRPPIRLWSGNPGRPPPSAADVLNPIEDRGQHRQSAAYPLTRWRLRLVTCFGYAQSGAQALGETRLPATQFADEGHNAAPAQQFADLRPSSMVAEGLAVARDRRLVIPGSSSHRSRSRLPPDGRSAGRIYLRPVCLRTDLLAADVLSVLAALEMDRGTLA